MDTQQLVDLVLAASERDRMKTMVTLGEMVAALAAAPRNAHVETDQGGSLSSPHSYRGYYSDLAFEPSADPVSVEQLLAAAREALGSTFQGYKGGDYTMSKATPVWLAEHGCCGREIRSIHLAGDKVIVGTAEHDY